MCKKYGENSATYEKAASTSEALIEHAMSSCTTKVVGFYEIREFGWKKIKYSNWSLVPTPLAENSVL